MSEQAGELRPARHPGVPLAQLTDAGSTALVTGVSLDSRSVRPGDLYVGLPGLTTHGARFAPQAKAAGAVAILTDAAGAALCTGLGLPVLVEADPRQAMAGLAIRIYGQPAARMTMYGLTGTNGKTSTTFLLEAGLRALGQVVGTIGTIGFRVGGRELRAIRTTVTTPESPDLQALLAVMAEAGAQSVAMEVSSHALALGRVEGIVFEVAGFTQLGQDHLDFHRDLEDYFQTKARLFLNGHSRQAVLNVDDQAGRRLAGLVAAEGRARIWTTALDRPADFRATDWRTQADGTSWVRAQTPAGTVEFTVGMLGEFNVRNALTALAMIAATGGDVTRAAKGFAAAAVPGRMQRVDLGAGAPRVVVDFAHTPQAVAAALAALPDGRRIVVLGCGGDRDPIKRGPMGEAAARGADVVIVTDDNPRSEEPAAIRAAVLAGARQASGARAGLILDGGDRRCAIAQALDLARPGDWVAVLGKGHETGQDIGGVVIPFDDVEAVAAEWTRRGGGRDADQEPGEAG